MPPQSLRALLNRIVDYAGLFPPAKLDMAAAVRNYKKYLQSDDSWMLGRLIVPVARLEEFESEAADLLPRGDDDEPWSLSVLAGPAGAPQFQIDLEAIESFNIRHEDGADGRAYIDMLEIKADSAEAIDAALEILPQEYFAFFELPIESDPRGLIAALGDAEAGAKVRTGGVTADLVPSARDLARFISACAAANVPFKATAGLHHPLRHHSESINAEEFGFFNVFLAGCLAMTDEMDEAEVLDLLQETSIESIAIRNDSIAWREHRIEAVSIEDVREEFAISFGSCSFDEPREGLRQLELL